jgi:endonuclease/exonuclease/phosphatase family metal-dependent hydrolase
MMPKRSILSLLALLALAACGKPLQPGQPSKIATATLGAAGGSLTLEGASVGVPAGALSQNVQLKLEQLPLKVSVSALSKSSLSTSSADFKILAQYRVSANTQDFKQPVEMRIAVEPAKDTITELYSWDGRQYTKEQIAGSTRVFVQPLNTLVAGGGSGSSFGITFTVTSTPLATLNAACTAQGGEFNGRYCSFANKRPSVQAQQTSDYKLLSINVGNANLSCVPKYAVKLCSYATEERVMQTIANENPDLVALQEVWNDNCKYITDERNPDRVCFSSATNTAKQITRLLGKNGGRYTYRCTPTRDATTDRRVVNGYECIAIKTSLFGFADALPAIQPACVAGENDPKKNYKGGDTGFQVERIQPKLGAAFDLVNAHMITPGSSCRLVQLNALRDRYYRGIQSSVRLLLAGDFNTDPRRLSQSAEDKFAEIFTVPGKFFGTEAPTRTAYLISSLREPTAYLPTYRALPINKPNVTLDHVLSNFADGSCTRGEPVQGLDHLYTRCKLSGFGTATLNTSMAMDDTATKPVEYQPWSKGKISVTKRGVLLTHAVTQSSGGRYTTALPNISVTVAFKGCLTSQTQDPVQIAAGQTSSLSLRFAEFFPVRCN